MLQHRSMGMVLSCINKIKAGPLGSVITFPSTATDLTYEDCRSNIIDSTDGSVRALDLLGTTTALSEICPGL